jgi:hypothetical protein
MCCGRFVVCRAAPAVGDGGFDDVGSGGARFVHAGSDKRGFGDCCFGYRDAKYATPGWQDGA